MATNPILDEINGLSPGAKSALMQAHQSVTAGNAPVIAPVLNQQSAASQPPPTMSAAMPQGSLPNLGQPAPPPVKAPRGTLQGDEAARSQMEAAGAPISHIYRDISQSRFGQAHPLAGKVIGGLAQGLGTGLEAAGSMFGPIRTAEQLIPGTTAHHNLELRQLNNQIADEEKEQQAQATTEAERARTGLETAQTEAIPAHSALEMAQAYRAMNPLVSSAFELWRQNNPNGTAQDYENMMQKPISQQQADNLNGVWDKVAETNGLPTGQFKAGMPASDANALSASLNNVVSRKQGQENIVIKQEGLNEKVPMLIPDGKGGYQLQYIQPGQTVQPGAMTPTQAGSVNVPTQQERTAAGRAHIVLGEIPNIEAQIRKDAKANMLGPIMGRWNDFMQGKVGSENPEFSNLRANLMLMSSAVALAHAIGRLPENLREQFDNMIDAPQQTPDNLIAIMEAIKPWMQDMADLSKPGANTGNANNTPQAAWQPPAGAPPAPKENGRYLYDEKHNPVAKSLDGKWVEP